MPTAATIAVLDNPNRPDPEWRLKEIEQAAGALGQRTKVFDARTESDFGPIFATIAQQRVDALFVIGDPFFTSRRTQLVNLAAQYAIPTSYSFRDFPLVGGLMSYGANLLDVHRQAGVYVGRILKGARPGDLPVLQPTKFDLVINTKTANTNPQID